MKRDEMRESAQRLDEEHRAKWAALMAHGGENLDEDGYPTELALARIEAWHWSDKKGWFDFIEGIWYLASWGWSAGYEDHEYTKDERVYRLYISTAGWSGNESLIGAMKQNFMLWGTTWVQSRRGGHYIFEIPDYEKEKA